MSLSMKTRIIYNLPLISSFHLSLALQPGLQYIYSKKNPRHSIMTVGDSR
jgi:hypothetical protein